MDNDLQVGDRVAYSTLAYKRARLRVGEIVAKEIAKGSINVTRFEWKVRPIDGYEGRTVTKRSDELVRVL